MIILVSSAIMTNISSVFCYEKLKILVKLVVLLRQDIFYSCLVASMDVFINNYHTDKKM